MPDKKPTMREIARAVGTSAATVSKALAGKPGMSGRLRKKIEKKAAEMGYAYPGKRKETPSSRLNIGILIPESYFDPESYYSTLCKKLVQKLSERGHTGLLEILSREQEKAPELPGLVRSGHADGLILLGQPGREYCRMIVRCGIPVLFLDFYDGQGTADAVVGDNSYGAYRLTGHLIRNGHTRIGFVGNRLATSSIMDRYLGYYRAMLTYGLPVREEWILKDRTDEGEPAEIALPGTLPTAFVCNADTVARKLIARLKERGLRVPEDISVTGFDDFEAGPAQEPALSTFRINTEGMIGLAVDTMEERCAGSDKPFGRVVVGGQPVYRGSEKAAGGNMGR